MLQLIDNEQIYEKLFLVKLVAITLQKDMLKKLLALGNFNPHLPLEVKRELH